MWLVHDAEYHLFVIDITRGELVPKLLELLGACGRWVGVVTNHRSSQRLLARIVVTHVIVRVQNCVCAFAGDGCDGVVEVVEVSLVELLPQAIRAWTHALEEEGDAEGVDLRSDKSRAAVQTDCMLTWFWSTQMSSVLWFRKA